MPNDEHGPEWKESEGSSQERPHDTHAEKGKKGSGIDSGLIYAAILLAVGVLYGLGIISKDTLEALGRARQAVRNAVRPIGTLLFFGVFGFGSAGTLVAAAIQDWRQESSWLKARGWLVLVFVISMASVAGISLFNRYVRHLDGVPMSGVLFLCGAAGMWAGVMLMGAIEDWKRGTAPEFTFGGRYLTPAIMIVLAGLVVMCWSL